MWHYAGLNGIDWVRKLMELQSSWRYVTVHRHSLFRKDDRLFRWQFRCHWPLILKKKPCIYNGFKNGRSVFLKGTFKLCSLFLHNHKKKMCETFIVYHRAAAFIHSSDDSESRQGFGSAGLWWECDVAPQHSYRTWSLIAFIWFGSSPVMLPELDVPVCSVLSRSHTYIC